MIRRPPRSTLFPYTTPSDLAEMRVPVDQPRHDEPHRCIERSEEHTSELQSQFHLVCRLLLEKKKNDNAALAHLRERLRKRGLRLMLNLVPIHIVLDHPWVEDHREYYIAGTVLFFFHDTATTESYTLSLHDALPI